MADFLCLFFLFFAGFLPLQLCSMPKVSMLPTDQELHCDPNHVCLHPSARHHHCLCDAVAWC